MAAPIASRVAVLESRIDGLQTEINTRFGGMQTEISNIRVRLHALSQAATVATANHDTLKVFNADLKEIEQRVDTLEGHHDRGVGAARVAGALWGMVTSIIVAVIAAVASAILRN